MVLQGVVLQGVALQGVMLQGGAGWCRVVQGVAGRTSSIRARKSKSRVPS